MKESQEELGIQIGWGLVAAIPALSLTCAGSGEFGDVYRAKWHGSFVAAKILKRSDEIALGDFRTEVCPSSIPAVTLVIHLANCRHTCHSCHSLL